MGPIPYHGQGDYGDSRRGLPQLYWNSWKNKIGVLKELRNLNKKKEMEVTTDNDIVVV